MRPHTRVDHEIGVHADKMRGPSMRVAPTVFGTNYLELA